MMIFSFLEQAHRLALFFWGLRLDCLGRAIFVLCHILRGQVVIILQQPREA